ncbi:MAG: hypothetical protein JXR77_01945 [Lentisphaeria bacterium]|nr:hypothetical protein [Lentisphaeria bacterium]
MRDLLTRRNIGLALLAPAAYLLIVPLFWPEPTAEITIPARATLGEGMVIEVAVSALHANVRLSEVYLVLDCPHYREVGLPASLVPVPVYQVSPTPPFPRWVNLTTYPRRQQHRFTVPLRALADQGVIRPGALNGHATASVLFKRVSSHRTLGRARPPMSRQATAPFRVTVEV